MSVYTKKGDGGETSLYSSDPTKKIRVKKNDNIIMAIGSIDEANSYIGICISIAKQEKNKDVDIEFLQNIQRILFALGSILAGANLVIQPAITKEIEKRIDAIENKLPPLKNFILPGGKPLSSHLMYARTLIRKMERDLVGNIKKELVTDEMKRFVNRLSDYFFVLARLTNLPDGEIKLK